MCVPSNFDDETRSIDVPLMLSSGSKEYNEWAVDICFQLSDLMRCKVKLLSYLTLYLGLSHTHFWLSKT